MAVNKKHPKKFRRPNVKISGKETLTFFCSFIRIFYKNYYNISLLYIAELWIFKLKSQKSNDKINNKAFDKFLIWF